MDTTLKILKCFLFGVLAGAIISITGAVVDFLKVTKASISQTSSEVSITLSEVRTTSRMASVYATSAIKALQDPRNAKSLQAGLDAAATLKGSLLLVNRQVIPRIMDTLDSLDTTVQSLNTIVRHTDTSVNAEITPAIVRNLDELQLSLKTVQDETRTVTQAITAVVADPSIPASTAALAEAAKHLDQTMSQVEEASRQLPSVARSIEKIAATSSKYRKIVLWAQILSTVKWALF